MADSDRSSARRSRREANRRRRRVQKFVTLLRQTQAEVEDIKERRPQATAVDKVVAITETGVGMSDSISTSTTTDPIINYNDADRGYGFAEYRG